MTVFARTVAIAAASVAMLSTGTSTHSAAAPPADQDAEALARQFLASWSNWAEVPTELVIDVDFGPNPFGAVLAVDGTHDWDPLDDASQGFGSDSGDIVQMLMFETQPLDPAVRDYLFNPETGLFRVDQPGVRHLAGVTLDPAAFDAGMRVVVVYAAAPRQPVVGAGSTFTAAVEWVNPVYGQGPPGGVFAGFPQLDRFDVVPQGDVLRYYQYSGDTYGSFSSASALVDTCSGPEPLDPCYYAFLSGLGRAERAGVTGVQVELYETDGTLRAADRLGAGLGSPVEISGLAPVTLTLQAVPPPAAESTTTAAPTTTVQLATTPAPVPAAAAPTSPPAAPTTAAATTTVGVQAASQPGAVAAEPEAANPVVAAAPDDSSSTGRTLWLGASIAALLAGTGIVIGVKRREGAGDAVAANTGTNSPTSILSYTLPEAIGTNQHSELDGAWSMILERNAEVESHVRDAGAALSATMMPHFLGLATAVSDFAAPYRRAVSGMVLLTEHQNEQEIHTARAKIANLATAIVSIGVLLKRAGMRAVRWWRPQPGEVAKITDEVAELLRLAQADETRVTAPIGGFVMNLRPPVIPPKPSWFNPPTGFAEPWGSRGAGEDLLFWEMDMMALETGDNLAALVRTRPVDEVLELLRLNVAKNRGINVVPTADALRLERIVINARQAERGEPYAFRIDDLQWLMSRRDPNARAGLATAVSAAEVAGALDGRAVPVILSAEDLRLVQGVMDRPGLADVVVDATTSARVDVEATGFFRAIIDPPAAGLTAPNLFTPGTGAFDAVIPVPPPAVPITITTTSTAHVYIPPTVGPGQLLDTSLDVIHTAGVVPDTIAPGHFLPWMVDVGSELPTPGTMTLDGATDLAQSLLAANRSGVMAGPAAPKLILSLPSDTPVLIAAPNGLLTTGPLTTGPLTTGPLTTGPLFAGTVEGLRAANADLNVLGGGGAGFVTVFGQASDTLTGPPLGTIVDISLRGADATTTTTPIWIGEFRPSELAFIPTSAVPAGSQLVLTNAGFAYVDPTQPMLANPNAPLPSGLTAGLGSDASSPGSVAPGPVIIPVGASDAQWFDPAWLAEQQQIIAAQGQQLTGVVDLNAFSATLFDRTWFESDFNLFGLTLDGGGQPAAAAWIVLSLGTAPYETLVRMQYGYIGAQHALNYLETYKGDYKQMQSDLAAAITALEGLQASLPALNSLLQDERDALNAMADEVGAFADANPEWAEANGAAVDAKLTRDLATIAHLDDSLAALRELISLLDNLVPWVRQLAVAPDGSAVSPLTLVNPTSLLRLASALLSVSDAYGRVFLLAPPRGGE